MPSPADPASPCPVCGSRDSSLIARRPPYVYLRCATGGCGCGRIDPQPPSEGIAQLYDRGYFVDGGARAGYADYEADERWHRATARARLTRVEEVRPPGTAEPLLVDVGTAVGFLPDEARRRGWRTAAVERSDWAAGRARQRGLRVESTLDELSDLPPADAITFFQVLEHIPDVVETLAVAASMLRSGGVLVCETWDAESRTARLAGSRWQQLSAPSVLWLFTPDSARRLITAAGLVPVSWRPTPKSVSLSSVLAQAIPTTRTVPGARAVRSLQGLTSRVPLPYRFDDLVTFVARKP